MTITPADRSGSRFFSDTVPIRLLTAEEIDAGRQRPSGSPRERAAEVAAILSRPTFTLPPKPLDRPFWYR